jgi:hypothetical protein
LLQKPAQFRGDIARDVTFLWVRILLRGFDGKAIPINANHAIELMGEAPGKETGATEGIDQDFFCAGKYLSEVGGDGVSDRIIGLREDARSGVRAQRVMTVANSPRAQLSEGRVDLWHRDRAALDIHEFVNIAPVKTNNVVLRVDSDSIPVMIRQRRGDHGAHGGFGYPPDPPHRLLNLARL